MPRPGEAQAPALRLPGCPLPGLHADQLPTRGNLELNDGFTATAKVRLDGAHIGGRLNLTKASLTAPNGPALSGGRLVADQSMFCCEGFTANGGVYLGDAHVRGRLSFSGATLTNKAGPALYQPTPMATARGLRPPPLGACCRSWRRVADTPVVLELVHRASLRRSAAARP
jgi:hypothetical protein